MDKFIGLEAGSNGETTFQDLELHLQTELSKHLVELDFLREEKQKIGNPENLGATVMEIVWEQFCNQLANTAGDDFIRENWGQTLDLRTDSHIQTTENFEKGKIATHNKAIDYQERHNDWKNSFKKDSDGNTVTNYDRRSNQNKAVLGEGARDKFDVGREKGSVSVHKDHTIPVAEIIRDPEANCHLSQTEQVKFANSQSNLKDLDSAANNSKGDSTMTEWLDSERNGKRPAERFNIDEEKCREDDLIARQEYEKIKKEGEKKSIETGRQSQKAEALRVTKTALKSVLMRLLADLVKEIFKELVGWLKAAKRNFNTLQKSLKKAFNNFFSNIQERLINAGTSLMNTIASSIWGPIFRTLSTAFTIIKQGCHSIGEALNYIRNPDNKNKPVGILILEVGKIVVAGLTAAGALILGDAIEKGLLSVPLFAIEIPLLGSLASILGLFLGGVVSGIIGAIVINSIDKAVARILLSESIAKEIDRSNEVLNTQTSLIDFCRDKVSYDKNVVANNIGYRHEKSHAIINEAVKKIFSGEVLPRTAGNGALLTGNEDDFSYLLGDK